MKSNKTFLYILILIGNVFILLSLINFNRNYHQQKVKINQHFIKDIQYNLEQFERELSFNQQYLNTAIVFLRKEIQKPDNIETGYDSIFNFIDAPKGITNIDQAALLSPDGKILVSKGLAPDFDTNLLIKKVQSVDFSLPGETLSGCSPGQTLGTYQADYSILSKISINDSTEGIVYLKQNIALCENINHDHHVESFAIALRFPQSKKTLLCSDTDSSHLLSSIILSEKYFSQNSPIVFDTAGQQFVAWQIETKFNAQKCYLDIVIIPKTTLKMVKNVFSGLVLSIGLFLIGLLMILYVTLKLRFVVKRIIAENQSLYSTVEKERKFKDMFDFSPLPMIIYQEGKVVLMNKSALTLAEIEDFDQVKNSSILDFVHSDFKQLAKQRMTKLLNESGYLDKDMMELVGPTGKHLTVEITSFRTEFNGQSAIHVTINDVTEKQRLIERIKQDELKYKTMFNQSADAIMLIKDEFFVECNDSAVEIYGFKTKSEILKLHPGSLSPEKQHDGRDSFEKADEMMQKCLQTGFNRFDWLHKKADNSLFWMDVILSRIQISGETYIHVMGRDITNTKEANQLLINSKNHLNNILKLLPIPVIIYNRNNEIIFTNNSFKANFGYTQTDIPTSESWWQQTIADEKHRADLRDNWDRAVLNSIETKNIVEASWNVLDKQGKTHSCAFFGILTLDEIVVVINDFTDLQSLNDELITAKEKAEESNRLKSAFLANLSHELRTPMNGILGFSQLLAFSDLSDEDRQSYVDIIQKSGQRLLTMINDIISISRIDAGLVDINSIPFPLLNAIREIFDFHSMEAQAKMLGYELNTNNISDSLTVSTDEQKFKQILSNLISNAIKYTPKGKIEIVCSVENEVVAVAIKDTGFGIKPENLSKIFERFVRLEDTSDKTEGTGLGLSISKAYARKMGLSISVNSNFGIGSEFILTIPLTFDHTQINKPNPTTIETPELHFDVADKNILVAEDDELNFMILKLYLDPFGANVSWAKNGKEAVEQVDNQLFDLIFMDLKMPIMDGFEAMSAIKSKYPRIPIIAQTAFTFSEDKVKCLETGFDDYMSKPLKKEVVAEIVRKYMNI